MRLGEDALVILLQQSCRMAGMRAIKFLIAGCLTASLVGSICASTPKETPTKPLKSSESIEQLLARHDTVDAEKRLTALLAENPLDVHAMTLFGAMREQQRLYKQAEASYRIALRANPSSQEALAALANLLIAEERASDALDVVEAWHNDDHGDLQATVLLASLYERTGKYAESLHECASLPASHQLRVLPTEIIDRLMLGQGDEAPPLIAELMKHSVEEPKQLSELAAGLLRHGMVADAAELLDVASNRLKPSAAILSASAEAKGRQGHLDQAQQLAARARQLDPDSTEALTVSAQIAAVQKDWTTAATYLEQVRRLAPPRTSILQSLAYAYVQVSDYDHAHSAALEWYELQPKSTDAALALGIVFVGAKHWGEADPLLDKVLAARPNDKPAHLAKGIAKYNLGALDSAVQQLTASLGQGAPDGEAHYYMGLVAKQRGDIEAATREMEAALVAYPSHQLALSSAGQLYAQQGKLEQARSVLEKAIDKLPEDAQSHYQLATVYRRLSMTDQAREQLEIYQRLIAKAAPARPVSK